MSIVMGTSDLCLSLLREVAVDVAHEEDAGLKALNKQGVFDLPELAFAYMVGKRLTKRVRESLPSEEVVWNREIKIGQRGITDLVLDVKGKAKLAVEFKMAHGREDYIADAKKLLPLLTDGYDCAICLLVDAYREDGINDGRIVALESDPGLTLRRVGELDELHTKSADYPGKEMSCITGVWRVVG